MSALHLEAELLVEWNDAARLILPINLLIFQQNKHKKHNSWNGLGKKCKWSAAQSQSSRVNLLRVSHLRLPNEFLIKILA
jgi:hypothetical protein